MKVKIIIVRVIERADPKKERCQLIVICEALVKEASCIEQIFFQKVTLNEFDKIFDCKAASAQGD